MSSRLSSLSGLLFGGEDSDSARRLSLIGVGLFVVAVLFLLSPVGVDFPAILTILIGVGLFYFIYALIVLALNAEWGYGGLINFGPVGFFAIGAYVTAILAAQDPSYGTGLGIPWPVALAVGVLATALFGAFIGATTIRLRADYLAIATLAVAEVVHDLAINFDGLTGGTTGLIGIPRPINELAFSANKASTVTFLIFVSIVIITYAYLQRVTESPYGRVLKGIRADELALESLGKNVFGYKVWVFIYGSALMGLAGGLLALWNGAIGPQFFTVDVIITVWAGLVIGGAGNNKGALLGLGMLEGLRLLTRFMNSTMDIFLTEVQFAALRQVIIGLLLVIVMIYRPQGIMGSKEKMGIDQ